MQAGGAGVPLLQRLEFQRLRGDVGHVEIGERGLGGARVVVGGAADQGETGEGDDRVDDRASVALEEAVDGRPRVEAGGEGRDDREALLLQRADDAVVVGGVAGEHVGAHDQDADRSRAPPARQAGGVRAGAAGQIGMVEADVRVIDGAAARAIAFNPARGPAA